jgi:hypothetical protein
MYVSMYVNLRLIELLAQLKNVKLLPSGEKKMHASFCGMMAASAWSDALTSMR